jgi:nicotinate dehydrogenase subunit B
MTTNPTKTELLRLDLTRRSVLKGTGALVVSFTAPTAIARAATAATAPKPLDPTELDSYLAIHRDGSATAFFGKIDGGQGTDVGIAQIVAEELDLSAGRVAVIMGDTARTIDQGGASGSFGITWGGKPMRHAACEARQFLLGLAAKRLKTPVEKLTVADGVVSVIGAPGKKIGYGTLIGGHFFNVRMKWNGKMGNALDVEGTAQPKKPADYKVVGTSPKRRDVFAKVYAKPTYVTDVRVPGMLHARVVRPPTAGAVPNSIDENSIKSIPGTRVVHKDGFVAVLAEKEWNAVRAAQKLKVNWPQTAPVFPEPAALYDYIRKAPLRKRTVEKQTGSVEQAIAGAAKVVTADYEWPGLRTRRHQERQDDRLDGIPKTALRARWRGGAARHAGRESARDLAHGSRLLRAQRCRRRGARGGVPRQDRRPSGTRPGHAPGRHRLGPQGPGFDPPRARRSRCRRQDHRLSVREQGLLASRDR